MGSAQMFLDAKRRGKVEMTLHLSQKAIALVNAMLRPQTSQLPIVGPTVGVNGPYSAKDDTGAAQIRSLIKLLETRLMRKNEANQLEFPEEGVTLNLRQTYIDRLNEMVAHYKPACLSVMWCEAYSELRAGLEGKELKDDNPEEQSAEEMPKPKKEKVA